MLNYGDQTPSRFELLSMVRKHSKLLLNNSDDQEDASDVEMDSRFWHDIMDFYFIQGKESRGRQEDDMLFFVRKMGFYGHGSHDNVEGNSPFFVRRWAPKLDELIGTSKLPKRPREAIVPYIQGCEDSLCISKSYPFPFGFKEVLQRFMQEVETTAAYPEICFAVDDFDSTFDAVVLMDVDHCYCVILNASDGAAFPSESSPQDRSSGDDSSCKSDSRAGKTKSSKITLFSGFVSYQMVRDAYDAGKIGFGSLLSFAHSPGKADRLYMKGPGGRGEVEVAVSDVVDQGKEEFDHHSGKGSAISKIVRRAASVASVAAKQAYAAASSTRSSYEEMLPLKCCLMSVSLPWEHIAHDLLFKGSPPVNL